MKPKFDLENEGQGHKSDTFRNQEKAIYFSEKNFPPTDFKNGQILKLAPPSIKMPNLKKIRLVVLSIMRLKFSKKNVEL